VLTIITANELDLFDHNTQSSHTNAHTHNPQIKPNLYHCRLINITINFTDVGDDDVSVTVGVAGYVSVMDVVDTRLV